MATVGIVFHVRVHGGITIQGYLDNTPALYRQALAVDSFTVERLEQSRIGDDNWYEARVRITPHGLRENMRPFTSRLEAILCEDPNIVVLDREVP